MRGADALLWHMQRPGRPMHTLKTAILDPRGLGRQITLDDVQRAIEPVLGHVPRATQRIAVLPVFGGRPFWLEDEDFDLADHLDEVTVTAPGSRAELDLVHSRLAAIPLDNNRPLWSMTLVHGLEHDRQAVVVRLHHAIADGIGALNTFLAVTTETPHDSVPRAPVPEPTPIETRDLWTAWLRDLPRVGIGVPRLIADAVRNERRARQVRREWPELPSFVGGNRNFANTPSGAERVCASRSFDLDDFVRVARHAGVTVNGVYHALIAAAMRDELRARGESIDQPAVGVFGIAADSPGSSRGHGNNVTPVNVLVHSEIDDPMERLVETARSCREGVDFRKATGLEMAGRWADYTSRLAPLLVNVLVDRFDKVSSHLATANVRGPTTSRWIGPVEVVDWLSFALANHPTNISVTTYSFAGHMSVGLVSTPEVLPAPEGFLDHMADELAELVGLSS